jgi:hypothetical protein
MVRIVGNGKDSETGRSASRHDPLLPFPGKYVERQGTETK